MSAPETLTPEAIELNTGIEAVINSPSPKKLVIAGPGTGKTTLFKQLLNLAPGNPEQRIVLTFIKSLKIDLENDLDDLAKVFTLQSYCLDVLCRNPELRGSLSSDFRSCPGLAHLIGEDWQLIDGSEAPRLVGEMRSVSVIGNSRFLLGAG